MVWASIYGSNASYAYGRGGNSKAIKHTPLVVKGKINRVDSLPACDVGYCDARLLRDCKLPINLCQAERPLVAYERAQAAPADPPCPGYRIWHSGRIDGLGFHPLCPGLRALPGHRGLPPDSGRDRPRPPDLFSPPGRTARFRAP